MDVISTIKIRNADGTYSDSMPIGTVSDYITVSADGSSLSSILGNVNLNKYGSIQSQINALGGGSNIADGVVYVGDDPEDIEGVPIEKINGIAFDAEGQVLKAYWEHEGTLVEAQLYPNGGGSSGGGFNEIYAETSMNLGRVKDSVAGLNSVTGGLNLVSEGDGSATFGLDNTSNGKGSATFGTGNVSNGNYNFVIGADNSINIEISNYGGHAFVQGRNNVVNADHGVCFGINNTIGKTANYRGNGSMVIGQGNELDMDNSLVVGMNNKILYSGNSGNDGAIIVGENHTVDLKAACCSVFGFMNNVSGFESTCIGTYNECHGRYSFCGGFECKTENEQSFAFGQYSEATGQCCVALGWGSKAERGQSFAAGYYAEASEYTTIAMGYYAKAKSSESVAIGSYNEANAHQSLALGTHSIVSGYNSIAIGYYAKASSGHQIVMGEFNIEDTESKYALIFGGGDYSTPKNIFTLDWNGNAWFSGSVTDGNGATLDGVELEDSGILTSSQGGKIILDGIYGNYEQNTTWGHSLFDFPDKTITQNGVTLTISNGIISITGTPTVTSGDVISDYYLGDLDLTKCVDNRGISIGGQAVGPFARTYDANGNVIYNHATSVYDFNKTKTKRVAIYISMSLYYVESFYNNGKTRQAAVYQYGNGYEPYTGAMPAPNPFYPQVLNISKFSTLTLSNELKDDNVIDFNQDIELLKINELIDKIDSNNITHYLAKVTLTGSEEIGGDAASGYFTYTPSALGKANSINVLSDHYRNVNGDLSETDYNIFIDENGNIRIQHSGFTSVDEYKTWLASNNVTIVYERAEAEIVALSSEVSAALKNLEIYSGKTTITVDSETIQPIIKVEYPTSLVGKYVLELKNNSGSSSGGGGDNSNIDLSSVVPDTRRIAGIDLKNDITIEELANALGIDNIISRLEALENIDTAEGGAY